MNTKIIITGIVVSVLLASFTLKNCSRMDRRMIYTNENGEKEYYISTAGGNSPITRTIEEDKHILIDYHKTWNPNPVPLSDSNYVFIKDKLPEWFAEHSNLDKKAIAEINILTTAQIKEKLKYIFTHFSYLHGVDVYLLKLQYGEQTYRIYINISPAEYNMEKDEVEYNVLMYPFHDEEWNRNFYENEKDYLRMRELEEDGYNKHFEN